MVDAERDRNPVFMDNLKQPSCLVLEGNLAENWRRFKGRFLTYLKASGLDELDDERQGSIFLHVAGEDAADLFDTFQFGETEAMDNIDVIMSKFESYCMPKKNINFERHWLFSFKQGTQSVDMYVTELKRRAKSCELGDLESSLLTTCLILGVAKESLKDRLLQIADLNLDKAVQLCRTDETSKQQLRELKGEDCTRNLDALSARSGSKSGSSFQSKPQHNDDKWHKPNDQRVQGNGCFYCGYVHKPRQCPAFRKTCSNCQGRNHFARVCKQSVLKVGLIENDVPTVEDLLEPDVLYIGELTDSQSRVATEWLEDVVLDGVSMTFKLDCGAQANVIPNHVFQERFGHLTLFPVNAKLATYSGEQLQVMGRRTFQVTTKNTQELLDFFVVVTHGQPILGIDACQKLNLLKRIEAISVPVMDKGISDILDEFQDTFSGLGCLKGVTHQIILDKEIPPVIHAARKVPLALQTKLKSELDRMESLEVIVKVDEPTDWVNPMIIVEKPNGSLRICLDPKELNKAIKREHFPLPTLDELASKLSGCKYFTVLDASSGFWQIRLDDESSRYCTFATPFGRYRFLRLPFGITSAPEVFQRHISRLVESSAWMTNYFDDILIFSKTIDDHRRDLTNALQMARANNIKFNRSKCTIGLPEVPYLGHVLTPNGIQPDLKKTQAIQDMPSPRNKEDLQRLLGMLTYLKKFIPNLADLTATLRLLLKKNVVWVWDANHEQAFQAVKLALTNLPTLNYFDVTKPVKLSVDASLAGLGGALFQDDTPVAFMSRALTDTEKRYSQIEKELLAVVVGLEKFHQFLYGRSVLVESDHRPLEYIFRKPLVEAPPRLQRLLHRTQRYTFQLVFCPGKELKVADALARAYSPHHSSANGELTELVERHVHAVSMQLPLSDDRRKQFQDETAKDESLGLLRHYMKHGLPANHIALPMNIKQFISVLPDLSEVDGLLLKGQQLVVPYSLRQEMLKLAHQGHLGVARTCSLAKTSMYWPGMIKDLEDMVSTCPTCIRYKNANQKEPMCEPTIPCRPWSKLASDLFHHDRYNYILCADYYSKFF